MAADHMAAALPGGRLGDGVESVDRRPFFAPVVFATEAPMPPADPPLATGAERIEIVLANGRRILVGSAVDADALARVLTVLERA